MNSCLNLDWCSYEAARYAVERWHYSRAMPTPPLVKIGVWEAGRFIGCVLFGRGATQNLGSPYGLNTLEVCELVRIALREHTTPVSRIVRLALRMLARRSPGLRLVVSFADPAQDHHGGIYQAGNWIYTGRSTDYDQFRTGDGRLWHPRQVSTLGAKRQYGAIRKTPKIADCVRVRVPGKHRYLMPLDSGMRTQLAPLAKPYPKRPGVPSKDGVAPDDQSGDGGSSSTGTLHMAAV